MERCVGGPIGSVGQTPSTQMSSRAPTSSNARTRQQSPPSNSGRAASSNGAVLPALLCSFRDLTLQMSSSACACLAWFLALFLVLCVALSPGLLTTLTPVSPVATVHRLAGVVSEVSRAATAQRRFPSPQPFFTPSCQITTENVGDYVFRPFKRKKRLVSPDKGKTVSLSLLRPQLAIENLDLNVSISMRSCQC